MKTETIVNKLKKRTKERNDQMRALEKVVGQIETACRGEVTNLTEVENHLNQLKEKVADMRAGMLAGLGHLNEADIKMIVNRYAHDATFIYNLLDVYARYDPDYFAQMVSAAEPDTRQDGWRKIAPAIRQAILAELQEMDY